MCCLDLGNTRVKLGRFAGGRLVEVAAYPRAEFADALACALAPGPLTVALLSTGAPEEEARWRDALVDGGASVWSPRPGDPTPVKVAYATPETLGADRLAAAVGAHALYGQRPALAIDFGTCITYEYLSAAGVYRGGVISPGLDMRLAAMHLLTGRLPRVTAELPADFPGDSTASCLRHGALGGAAREVAGFVRDFREIEPAGAVVACGGGFAPLAPLLPADIDHRPHLVLEGLALMHAYAQTT